MDPFATRAIGRTGLHVTQLGCGGATLGDIREVIPESQADVTLEGAYAAGIGYFDTAPWYGNGRSEHRLGHVLGAKPRESYVLSTKIGRVFFRPPIRRPTWPAARPGPPRGAALRPALRLHPRRGLPLLRGQPAAPRDQHRGRPPDPRPRPGLPQDRGGGRRPPGRAGPGRGLRRPGGAEAAGRDPGHRGRDQRRWG